MTTRILLIFLLMLFISDYSESNSSLVKNIPQSVVNKLMSDYKFKAESTAGMTSIYYQADQTYIFTTNNKAFTILPFTYIPSELGSWKQCAIRVLAMPGFVFKQDLDFGNDNIDEIPCNGILALSFKDVTADGNNDIIALYDFTTSGNNTIEPYVAIYIFDQSSKLFSYNKKISEKARHRKVRNMKDVFNNLRAK